MEALVMHIGPQTASAGGQTVQPLVRVPEAAGKGSFLDVLRQVAAAAGSEDASPVAVMVPGAGGLWNLQPMPAPAESEEASPANRLAAAIGRLLALLEADGDLAGRLAEDPAFAEWLAEAAALLNVTAAGAPQNAESPVPAEDGEPGGFVLEVLSRLIRRLGAGETDGRIVAAGERLKAVLERLAGANAQMAQPAGNEHIHVAEPKAKAAEEPIRSQPVPDARAGEPANAGERRATGEPEIRVTDGARASNPQLLDRLVHLKPNVAAMAAAAESEAVAVTAATAAETLPEASAAGTADDSRQPVAPSAVQPAAAPKAEHAAGPVARTPVIHVRQFAQEMADLAVKRFAVVKSGTLSEARIRLIPEHLGELDVKISVQNGTVTALFTAETAAAREMLEMQLPMLRTALQQQGFQVDRLVVTQQQTGGPAPGFAQDERGQHAGNQERRQGGAREAVAETEPFDMLLPDMDAAYDDILLSQGSTFHATA